MFFYSERTPGYDGEPVDGVGEIFETTDDHLTAVIRVMPHANEPRRMEQNLEAMKQVRVVPLSEFQGKGKPETKEADKANLTPSCRRRGWVEPLSKGMLAPASVVGVKLARSTG